MTTVTCSVCGGCSLTPVLAVSSQVPPYRDYDILCCGDCNHNQLDPPPTETELGKFYCAEYPQYQSGGCRHATFRSSVRRWLLQRAYGSQSKSMWGAPCAWRLLPNYPEFVEGGSVLDIGCGVGDVLSELQQLGWKCTGIDRNHAIGPPLIAEGIQFVGGDVCETLRSFPDQRFDAVVAIHSLEHFIDPPLVVQEIARVLVGGGQLIIVVPSIEGVAARTLGREWPQIRCPGHLQFFTRESLKTLVTRAGCVVDKWAWSQIDSDTAAWVNASGRTFRVLGRLPMLVPLVTQIVNLCGCGDTLVVRARKPK